MCRFSKKERHWVLKQKVPNCAIWLGRRLGLDVVGIKTILRRFQSRRNRLLLRLWDFH